mgnify:FL=1
MKGFYLCLGRQGSGKTLFMTKHLVDNFTPNRPVFSNYTLFDVPYQKITFGNKKEVQKGAFDILEVLEEDSDFFNNAIMLLDEIHLYFDSRDYMRSNVRKIQTFFSQLRKRNILMLASTQYILNLDVRIRRQALAVFQMKQVKDTIFEVETHEIDGYFTNYIRTDLFNLEKYFKYYDTNEIIE